MASVGGTTFAATSGESTITAEITGVYAIDGVDDISIGTVGYMEAPMAGFHGSAQDTFCIFSNVPLVSDVVLSPVSLTIGYDSSSLSTQLGQADAYSLTASATKLVRSEGNSEEQRDVLDYTLTLSDDALLHSWAGEGDSVTSCSTQNHTIAIGVSDADLDQRSGSYTGSVTLTIAEYAP